MLFEHRAPDADARVLDRVWRTRSENADTMTSVARTSFHLILARTSGVLVAGLRGPETRASRAPVPSETEYLGIRFAVGAVLRPHPAQAMVDGYVPLPVTDRGRIVLGGQEWEAPTFENAEAFVERLTSGGLLVPALIEARDESPGSVRSARTRQRRHRALIGMAPTTATQIERANSAVARLTAGQDWPEVVRALGYFDQPHLAHALQRFVGRTAGELRTSGLAGMSFLYKTGPEPAE